MRRNAVTDILLTVIVIVSWCGMRTGAAVVSAQVPERLDDSFASLLRQDEPG
jgi:hypothetical protein